MKLIPDKGIQVLCEIAGQVQDLDELLHIGKVFQQVKGRPLYVIDTVNPGDTSRGAETRAREEVERRS